MRWHMRAAVLMLALCCGLTFAAQIEPDLVRRLDNADSPSQKFQVDFFMKAQASALDLDASIEQMPKPERRARVGRVLMDFAAATQADLLVYLKDQEAAGKVDDIRPLWIANSVGCWATREVILAVAARADVDLVIYDRLPVEIGQLELAPPPVKIDGIEPNMATTNVRGAWKQGYHGENVVLSVVDTGVRYTHYDIRGHVWTSTVYPNPGFNIASNQYTRSGHAGPSSYDTLTPLDYYGHGTHCAGIATADGAYGNNTRDTMGIAPSAKIMSIPVDVYLHSPYPDTACENSTMLGFEFSIRPFRDTLNGADAITTSLGFVSGWLPRHNVWRVAENNVLAAGLLHCVAAGNEASAQTIRAPGACPPPWHHPSNGTGGASGVMTIGATDNSDARASFSSQGPSQYWPTIAPWNDYPAPTYLMDPDLMMPGSNILSTYNSGDQAYTTMSGTSMATPGAAGVCCLMLSKNPYLTPREADSILEMHSVRDLGASGKDNSFGAGRINCSLAVAFTPFPNDVGVKNILTPFGTIDSGAIVPACTAWNYGGATQTYVVRMKIDGTYDQTASVVAHPGNTGVLVTFPAYTCPPRGGPYAVSCSTELTGDTRNFNDKTAGTFSVQVRDVAVTWLIEPDGDYDSTDVTTPACSVFNYGSMAVDGAVMMRIGTFYDQTAAFTALQPLASAYVTFPDWTAEERSDLVVTCSTVYANEGNPTNDAQTGAVFVRVVDAEAALISGVPTVCDSGAVASPSALLRNRGNEDAEFDVVLVVDDGYDQTLTVEIPAESETTVTFPDWTVALRGLRTMRCSTELDEDMVDANDWKLRNTLVRVHDAAAIEVIDPSGALPPGTVVPKATVRNNGTQRSATRMVFMINSTPPYQAALTVGNGLPLGVDTTITFTSWVATAGAYTAKCSVYLPTDQVHANDIVTSDFTVGGSIDVAVIGVSPSGYASPGYVTPRATVQNLGTVAVNVPVVYWLAYGGVDLLCDTTIATSVGPGATATVAFDSILLDTGAYTSKAKSLFRDPNPANDSMLGSFRVSNLVPGWYAKAVVPAGPKGKNVKDGGALVYAEGMDDGKVYAFKGNNRYEFYAYNVADNVWATLESIPAIGRAGKKKAVKKGASLAFANGKVLGAKGNNSVEFWEYTPGTDAGWAQKPDVPLGARVVKEGSGQATVVIGGSPYVYLLKGSATTEFYRYDVTTEAWETKAVAPLGASGKAYKNGSTIAYDGMGTIYAVKGSYNEFFSYSVDSDRWSQLASVPLIGTSGKKKKLKDGAGLGCIGDNVYALKGGNTQEFYVYSKATNAWTQKEDIPLGGGKRVKGGGAVTSTGAVLYVLKGNNTAEFYQYVPGAFAAQASSFKPQALAQAQAPSASYALRITPNPFSGTATISYTLPRPGNISLQLYDVTGKLVTTLAEGYHPVGSSSFSIQRSALSSGIYLVRLATETNTTTSKLIVE